MSWHKVCVTKRGTVGKVYVDWFRKFLQAHNSTPFNRLFNAVNGYTELDKLLAPNRARGVHPSTLGAAEDSDNYIEFQSEHDYLIFLLKWT